MIIIKRKEDCCGCEACVQRCPKHCITMCEDEEGFFYPKVNVSLCIDCALCEKVCPVLNKNAPSEALGVYAAINPDKNVRINSSSGGIFSMLAEYIIDKGGVVFGVGYNDHWEASHGFTETKEGLAAFRMSKYIQSRVGENFKLAESFLKKGRIVLFTGTPCQISGFKKYLRKDYENLLTVDFICHGVPSPGVFRWYLSEELKKISVKNTSSQCSSIMSIPKVDQLAKDYGLKILDIRFRDKKLGWKKFSFSIDLSRITKDGKTELISISHALNKNYFLRGFLRDLYLRPSCYHCPSREMKSGSDITIGDYWGIQNLKPNIDDDKGVSAIVVKTSKGNFLLNQITLNKEKMSLDSLLRFNPAMIKSPLKTKQRVLFFSESDKTFFERIDCYGKLPLIVRFKNGLHNCLHNLLRK